MWARSPKPRPSCSMVFYLPPCPHFSTYSQRVQPWGRECKRGGVETPSHDSNSQKLTRHPNPPADPGFCNTNLRMVHVSIDMSLPENQDLKPELEENEFIEVFTVPLAKLFDECARLAAEGCAIDARVGTLAEGVELAKRFKF